MATNSSIRIGGLFRCCIDNILNAPESEEKEGNIIMCPVCKDQAVFKQGAWEWKK